MTNAGRNAHASLNGALVVQTEVDLFPLSVVARDVLRTAGLRYIGVPTDQNDLARREARVADAVMVSAFTADSSFIESLERCKVIARCGVGIDNIDIEAARERGIVVTYVPDFCTIEVAEHTLALLLACERLVARCDRDLRSGRWPRYRDLGEMRRLAGLTVGIVGFGRIGRKFAELAKGLAMNPIAHDPYVTDSEIRMNGAAPVSLDGVLEQSAILSLHLPLNADTRGWLGSERLRRLSPGVTVINTARGALVDEAALLTALRTGHVRAAGLDVFEQEPPMIAALIQHPNVVATPHSAAFSEEALRELFSSAAYDVVRVLSGSPPANPVPLGPETERKNLSGL